MQNTQTVFGGGTNLLPNGYQGDSSRIKKRLRRKAEHSHSSTAEVTNKWSYTSTSIRIHDAHRDSPFLVEPLRSEIKSRARYCSKKLPDGSQERKCCMDSSVQDTPIVLSDR
jgi:hypothetical protein